jgi:hypothetical protein
MCSPDDFMAALVDGRGGIIFRLSQPNHRIGMFALYGINACLIE